MKPVKAILEVLEGAAGIMLSEGAIPREVHLGVMYEPAFISASDGAEIKSLLTSSGVLSVTWDTARPWVIEVNGG